MMLVKRALLVSAAIGPIWAFAAPAYSQAAVPAAPAGGAEATDGGGIGEIVVTATRRSENLQKAPAAITVVTGGQLVANGIVDTTGLTRLVPSSRISTGPTDGIIQAIIRGIGNDLATPFVYEPVALNMNDAYVPRVASTMPLFDIDRVEVLPGPQGTLYGKSALGGVINVNAKAPTQRFGVDLSASYGNYDAVHLIGVINVPVTDTLAVRVATDYDNHDSYFTNGNGKRDSFAIRTAAKYTPRDDVSVYVWGEYNRQRNVPAALIYVNPFVNDNPFHQPRFDPLQGIVDNQFNRNNRDSYRVGGRLDFTLGGVQVSYIPTYLDFKANTVAVNINRYVPSTHHLRHLTQELRFSGEITDKLSWLGGLYYEDSKDRNVVGPNFTKPTLPPSAGFGGDFASTSKGANVQLRYAATDALRLIAGGRYTKDTATPRDAVYYLPNGTFPFPDRSKKSWDNFDWKLAVEADVGPRSMLYANVQTAYSPGGYQSLGAVAGQKVAEQNMTGYTIGTKNRFLDNTLQFNVEAFYYDYKNYLLALTQAGLQVSFTVPKSRSYGADISLVYAPTPNTRINVDAGLLDATIRRFVFNNVDYAGNDLPASPHVTISAGLEQIVPLSDDGELTFRADTFYNSGFHGEYTNSPFTKQKDYTRTNLSLTYSRVDAGWSIAAYVQNIEKSYNKTLMALTGRPAPFAAVGGVDVPQTYGVRLQWKFGHP